MAMHSWPRAPTLLKENSSPLSCSSSAASPVWRASVLKLQKRSPVGTRAVLLRAQYTRAGAQKALGYVWGVTSMNRLLPAWYRVAELLCCGRMLVGQAPTPLRALI